MESRQGEGSIDLNGELFIHMVYLGTEESGQLQCLELAVPLQTQVGAEEADPQMISWVRVRLAGGELEAAEDFDGEERMLQLTAVLEVDYTLWQEQKLTLIKEDADETIQMAKFAEELIDYFRNTNSGEREKAYFEKMLDLKYENECLKQENQELKAENRSLRAKLEKACDFMRQFTINGINMLEHFLRSIGEWVQQKVAGMSR